MSEEQVVIRDLVTEVVDRRIAENCRKSVGGENAGRNENPRKVGSRMLVSPSIRKKSDSISSHDDDSFEEEEFDNDNQKNGKLGFMRKQQQQQVIENTFKHCLRVF